MLPPIPHGLIPVNTPQDVPRIRQDPPVIPPVKQGEADVEVSLSDRDPNDLLLRDEDERQRHQQQTDAQSKDEVEDTGVEEAGVEETETGDQVIDTVKGKRIDIRI